MVPLFCLFHSIERSREKRKQEPCMLKIDLISLFLMQIIGTFIKSILDGYQEAQMG